MILSAQYRWSVLSRTLAAIGGGYVLASLLSVALSLLLSLGGMNKAEAVLAMTMISFLIYAAIIMAVFHASTATRAWIGLAIACVPPALFSVLYDGTVGWALLRMF